jgi:hypothetical protein
MRIVSVFAAAVLLSGCGSDVCDDQIVARIPSPNRLYDAIYSIHDCGPTAGKVIWIRIVEHEAAPESAEPVATFDGELTSLPEWTGRMLHVHYGHAKPITMQPTFEAARIEYTAD